MIKKIYLSILLTFVAICLYYWQWIPYGLNQGRGQLKVLWEARPIEDFLSDPNYPDSLKSKLLLTKEVRKFATDSLGLHRSENYTRLFDQKGEPILWNVSASSRYALEAHEWNYPFLGSMPYKGFFKLEKAQNEAQNLESEGYDVRVRTVTGWSTLGIFTDPLLSNMLERNDGALAEVIIHELTHATIFVKNEIEFNENLASFIGERGAERFLIAHFGDSSAQHLEYIQSESDSKLLTQIVLQGANDLDELYRSFDEGTPDPFKDSLKTKAIRSITNRVDTAEFYNPKYREIFSIKQPNNAYFMAFRRYHDQEDSIRGIYKSYDYNLATMISALKEAYGK